MIKNPGVGAAVRRASLDCTCPGRAIRSAPRSRQAAAEGVAGHRRPQRLPVGRSREGRGRHRQARHAPAAADADDGLRAARGGRRRRAVLVGLRAGGIEGRRRGQRDARADRHRAPDGREVPGQARARVDGRRCRADWEAGQDRVADWRRGRALHQRLARRAAHVLPARRALHDAHAHLEHVVGRFGDRHAEERRAVAVRRGAWCAR